MARYKKVPGGASFDGVVSVAQGGTGATDKEQALINLGAFSRAKSNQPGQIGQLDSQGFVPSAITGLPLTDDVRLEGPRVFWFNKEMQEKVLIYRITNFDSFKTYAITTDGFTDVQLNHPTVGYLKVTCRLMNGGNVGETLSGGATRFEGPFTFTINGKAYEIEARDGNKSFNLVFPATPNYEFQDGETVRFTVEGTPSGLRDNDSVMLFRGKGSAKLPAGVAYSFFIRGGSAVDGVPGKNATVVFDGATMVAAGATQGVAKITPYVLDLSLKYKEPMGLSDGQLTVTFDIPETGYLEILISQNPTVSKISEGGGEPVPTLDGFEVVFTEDTSDPAEPGFDLRTWFDQQYKNTYYVKPSRTNNISEFVLPTRGDRWYLAEIGGRLIRFKTPKPTPPKNQIAKLTPPGDPVTKNGKGFRISVGREERDNNTYFTIGSRATGNVPGRFWRYAMRNNRTIDLLQSFGEAVFQNDEAGSHVDPLWRNNRFGEALMTTDDGIIIGAPGRSPWQPNATVTNPQKTGGMFYLNTQDGDVGLPEPVHCFNYNDKVDQRHDGYAVGVVRSNVLLSVSEDMHTFSLYYLNDVTSTEGKELRMYNAIFLYDGRGKKPIVISSIGGSTALILPTVYDKDAEHEFRQWPEEEGYPTRVLPYGGFRTYEIPVGYRLTLDSLWGVANPIFEPVTLGADRLLVSACPRGPYNNYQNIGVVKTPVGYSLLKFETHDDGSNQWQLPIIWEQDITAHIESGATLTDSFTCSNDFMAIGDDRGNVYYFTFDNQNTYGGFFGVRKIGDLPISDVALIQFGYPDDTFSPLELYALVGVADYDNGVGAVFVYR